MLVITSCAHTETNGIKGDTKDFKLKLNLLTEDFVNFNTSLYRNNLIVPPETVVLLSPLIALKQSDPGEALHAGSY